MATLSAGVIAVTQVVPFCASAFAHERDFDDGPDDQDNSGHGNADDFDDFDLDDSSGHGSGQDDDHDFDDDHGADQDNSGHGNGDNFDDNDHHDDNDHTSDRSGHNDGNDEYDAPFIAEEVIYSVEYDSHGGEFVPGEIVFVGRAQDLAQALNSGFSEISVQNLASGGVMARLGLPPRGVTMEAALVQLSELAPDAIATPNNIYRSAQAVRASVSRTTTRRTARPRGTLGVIDTGVDGSSMADSLLSQRAFAGPTPVARDHGSMVASIAVARGVRVHVADVFGHSMDGGLAASAERIAAALDWMIAHRIAVVNISVEGPDNAVLAEMVRRAAERGHIIVAAAGNGGPAARPSFPAAFDGVLAVTAIDESDRPYVRANRGDYIDFAAPGVDINVDVNGSMARVSGTSFAAPVIAAEAAAHLHAPSPAESARVLTNLRARAEDLGAPGRDNIFGWGALRD
ncbi:MAG: S8 family serine peptidase [Terricaulis sp.]